MSSIRISKEKTPMRSGYCGYIMPNGEYVPKYDDDEEEALSDILLSRRYSAPSVLSCLPDRCLGDQKGNQDETQLTDIQELRKIVSKLKEKIGNKWRDVLEKMDTDDRDVPVPDITALKITLETIDPANTITPPDTIDPPSTIAPTDTIKAVQSVELAEINKAAESVEATRSIEAAGSTGVTKSIEAEKPVEPAFTTQAAESPEEAKSTKTEQPIKPTFKTKAPESIEAAGSIKADQSIEPAFETKLAQPVPLAVSKPVASTKHSITVAQKPQTPLLRPQQRRQKAFVKTTDKPQANNAADPPEVEGLNEWKTIVKSKHGKTKAINPKDTLSKKDLEQLKDAEERRRLDESLCPEERQAMFPGESGHAKSFEQPPIRKPQGSQTVTAEDGPEEDQEVSREEGPRKPGKLKGGDDQSPDKSKLKATSTKTTPKNSKKNEARRNGSEALVGAMETETGPAMVVCKGADQVSQQLNFRRVVRTLYDLIDQRTKYSFCSDEWLINLLEIDCVAWRYISTADLEYRNKFALVTRKEPSLRCGYFRHPDFYYRALDTIFFLGISLSGFKKVEVLGTAESRNRIKKGIDALAQQLLGADHHCALQCLEKSWGKTDPLEFFLLCRGLSQIQYKRLGPSCRGGGCPLPPDQSLRQELIRAIYTSNSTCPSYLRPYKLDFEGDYNQTTGVAKYRHWFKLKDIWTAFSRNRSFRLCAREFLKTHPSKPSKSAKPSKHPPTATALPAQGKTEQTAIAVHRRIYEILGKDKPARVRPSDQKAPSLSKTTKTSVLSLDIKSSPITVQEATMASHTKVDATLPSLPEGWSSEKDFKAIASVSAATQRSIEPVGPHFLAHARRARHKRTFSEDDRIQAQENVKKVEDDDSGEISEPEDPMMLARDAKDWKNQDHYAVLGLSKYRYKATEEQIKRAHRKKVLRHHPDKKAAAGSTEDDSFFKCIQKATDILLDPVKRRQYDSVDEGANVEPPSKKEAKGSKFYKLWGKVFESEGRFSRIQPVPRFGDEKSSLEDVEAFYNYFYSFDSWRSFEYQDEDVPDDNESRDQKRHIERKNNNARKKKKTEDSARLRKLVDAAAAGDERIKKFRQEANASKNKKRLEKEAAEKKAIEDAKAAKEAQEKAAKEAEDQAKANKEVEKKAKEAAKNAIKKNRRVLRDSVKDANYFAEGTASADHITKVTNDVEAVIKAVDADETAALASKLAGLKVKDEVKAVWIEEVKSLVAKKKIPEGQVKGFA